jgi:hypothetical protein
MVSAQFDGDGALIGFQVEEDNADRAACEAVTFIKTLLENRIDYPTDGDTQ